MNNKSDNDKVYASQRDMIVDFVFDEQVANVFPDMIRRSVPGYDTLIPLLGVFAERYVQTNTTIYDLGCSLGAATLAIRRRIKQPGCRIIAVDNAQAMVTQCREHISQDQSTTPVEVVCNDVLNIPFSNASLVVMYFTLQFIQPDKRPELIQRVYDGLNTGGAMIIADKIVFDNKQENRFHDDMHVQFKLANGYSELEISQKRTALENVLIPDSLATHEQRFRQTGFSQVYKWFQCFNFAGLCAIK